MDAPGEVTFLLNELSKGNSGAARDLYPLVYAELRRLAASRMRHERSDHTLQPTALVHEAYIRLVSHDRPSHWQNRQHFFAVSANVMRHILVDHARRRMRAKRGGLVVSSNPQHIDGAIAVAITPELSTDIVALHEALERLARLCPRQAQIMEYRFFGGVSVAATAVLIGVSTKTVKRDSTIAKAWLYGELRGSRGPGCGEMEKN
jgi:RNA polymerase sigma factor (TIGR02999 family)